MDFEFSPAVWAGLIAGTIMEMPVYLQKAIGLPVKQDIFRTWGTMLKLHGTPGRVAGVLVHELVAAAVALIYAWGFRFIFHADNRLWLWGLVGGVIHYAIAGVVVGMLPAVHPEIPERIPAQGPYYKNYGPLDMVTFLTGHLTFGLLVGILYGLFTGGRGVAF